MLTSTYFRLVQRFAVQILPTTIFFLFLSNSAFANDTTLTLSVPSGLYDKSFQVEVNCSVPTDSIYYAFGGSPADSASRRYSSPLVVDSNQIIWVAAYVGGKKLETVGAYIFGERETTYPIVSVVIDPFELFNKRTGLLTSTGGGSRFPHYGANYYSTREVKCHVAFIEENEELAFEGFFGFRNFGGTSRVFRQKSFSIAARRKRYGTRRIQHQVFPDLELKEFKHLVFRNSGSEFSRTHFRDALMTGLGAVAGLEVQAYRPCLVFLNGEYWGIYNIREKANRHYFVGHFGVHKDSLDIMESKKYRRTGTTDHYFAMRAFMDSNDLSIQANFDTVQAYMDTDNFMEYQIMQTFIENQDAGGNSKYWRPRPDGRWRWVLFDTDFGFGHYGGSDAYEFNSLKFFTEANGPRWPNPPWSTFIFRKLLENEDWRDAFIQRFADRMNYNLHPNYVTAKIDSMAGHLAPEMERYRDRWDLDSLTWHKQIRRMKTFAEERPAYIRRFIQEMFPHVGPQVQLQLALEGGKGTILINQTAKVRDSLEAVYFQNLGVKFTAQPDSNYNFSHWLVDGDSTAQLDQSLQFTDTLHKVTAIFKPKPVEAESSGGKSAASGGFIGLLIGGGVLLVGGIVFFVMRRKRKPQA